MTEEKEAMAEEKEEEKEVLFKVLSLQSAKDIMEEGAQTIADHKEEYDKLLRIWKEKDDPGEIIMNTYRENPMYKYYITRGGDICRVFGAIVKNDQVYMHALVARLFRCFRITDGIPVGELIPVERWTHQQLMVICACGHPELFLNPDGYLEIIARTTVDKN